MDIFLNSVLQMVYENIHVLQMDIFINHVLQMDILINYLLQMDIFINHKLQIDIFINHELQMGIYIYIYIYAFSRRFYPKRLTLHSSYSFYILSALAFPGNRTHDLGVANAMLYQLSYRKAVFS